jgi:hypothetical protein
MLPKGVHIEGVPLELGALVMLKKGQKTSKT